MIKKTEILKLLPIAILVSGINAYAVPIGIIDSGVDFKHRDLVNHSWLNSKEVPGDGVDNDSNGYIDDVNGWNFAENNNQVIDYNYLGKFSPDVKKYFDIQLKVINGTASPEEKNWVIEKKKDNNFIKELMTFGNFVHGTHVAGIATKSVENAKALAAKIIPTEVKGPQIFSELSSFFANRILFNSFQPTGIFDDFIMNTALGLLAAQQSKILATVGQYMATSGMVVANCSFGTSMTQAKMVVGLLGKALLKRDLNAAETEKYAFNFISQVIEKGSSFVTGANKTLFVMAAGNDGTDNDHSPVFPANLKFDNTLSVAATNGNTRLASFSNYGATQVEIAAPGVGIISSIPGNETLALSGTSQAAPYIANLAGLVLDTNPKLTFAEVKKVLMQTVDKKTFLEGKVASGGIANHDRALRAAQLSTQTNLEDAIARSRMEVSDVQTDVTGDTTTGIGQNESEYDGDPIPLPNPLDPERIAITVMR